MKKRNTLVKNKNVIEIGLILIIPVIFFIEPIIQQKVLYWGTTSTQFFPWMEYTIQQVLSGNLPLWNPYNGWGAPLMANYQSAIFYPPNWLVIIFYMINPMQGINFGYTVLLILHLQIGGLGFYRLLSRLELNNSAKLLGGMVFVLSGYLLSRINFISMVWTMVWMPWIVRGVLDLFSVKHKSSPFIQLSLILPVGFQLLAGHAQITYYTLMLSSIIFISLITLQLHKTSLVLKYILNILLSIGIGAIQLIPTAEYLIHSQRNEEVGFAYAANFSFWPWRILSVIFPDFWGNPIYGRYLGGGNYWEDHLYLGVFPIIFILFGAFILLKNKERLPKNQSIFYRICLILIPLSILMALGKNFILFPFFYHYVPTFNMFQAPSRFLLVYTFCGAVLAAFGFEVWQKKTIPAKKTGIFIFIFLAIVIGVFISQNYIFELPVTIVYSLYFGAGLALLFGGFSIFKNLFFMTKKNVLNLLIIFIVFIDLFLFSNQSGLFKPAFYYDKLHRQNEGLASGIVYLEKRTEEFIKFNQNFRFDRFQDFKRSSSEDLLFLPNTNLFNPPYQMINNFDPFVPGNYAEFMKQLTTLKLSEQKIIMEALGVTMFVHLDTPFESKPDITHLKNEDIVQWYNCGVMRPADEILRDLIYNGSIQDKNRCLLLTGYESLTENNQKTVSLSETMVSYRAEKPKSFEIIYSSKNDGWLVIRNNFYPGWKAVLDEETSLAIQEADYLFTGIEAPAGTHKIVVFYQPISFRLGILISLASILIVFLMIRKTF